MKKIILLLAISLNFAFALIAHADTSEYNSSTGQRQITVKESKYTLNVEAKANSLWAMIKISKGEAEDTVMLKLDRPVIKSNLYFKNGAGTYKVQIFESSSKNQYDSYYFSSTFLITNKDQRDLSYLLPSTYVQSDNAEIIALANSITADSRSDMESLRKIHHYVATNVQYDWDSYKDGSYANKPFDALTTFKRARAVCAGYSNLYAALLRAVGIRARVINGLADIGNGMVEKHAWNEVYIDNEWSSVDVTWDSTLNDNNKYFLMPDALFAKDHLKEKVMDIY